MLSIKVFKGLGRGLVATKNIKKGTIVHVAEVIHLNRKDSKIVARTFLDSYVYCLGNGTVGLALGLGSLFNHNEQNNVEFTVKTKAGRKVISYKAISNIPAGSQVFLNYGYDPALMA